ncbi:hypothetical protein LUW75_03900 [Streptomyces sp. MRC013]|uniref:hypothetical protein n=1 Tax=Streptomyces sp. MRC013 TaxID=2898276 RepID=UPI002026E5E7|nr:hypothetical protein [Streptomyces sp. MRC013]URM89293.1 hypothetical protein LUW75_03900 [Streptomyces sp. MRC013]
MVGAGRAERGRVPARLGGAQALRRLPAALAAAGQGTVTAAMAPLAKMFADAGGTAQPSREQARRRVGDFEIVEYVPRGQPGGVSGT